jgi:hypothetical protein
MKIVKLYRSKPDTADFADSSIDFTIYHTLKKAITFLYSITVVQARDQKKLLPEEN